MKIRANRQNIKKHASALLGANYTPDNEKSLIQLCERQLNLVAGVHPSHTRRERLAEIDKLLGNYGVEGLLLDRHGNDMSGTCSMSGVALDCQYSNTGDTYAMTIMYVGSKLFIGDWGCLVDQLS